MNTTLKTADGTTTIEADPRPAAGQDDPRLPGHAGAAGPGAHRPGAVRAVDRPERPGHRAAALGRPHGWQLALPRPPVDGEEYAFHGSFHEVRDDRIVQTFTFDGYPDGVSLETMWFEDLGDGRTRMHSTSLVRQLEGRDMMLSSGMEVGINDGYAKLDALLADGAV